MKKENKCEYSDEDLLKYMRVPIRKKLQWIEDTNQFFHRFMPEKSKKIWEQLQKEGF